MAEPPSVRAEVTVHVANITAVGAAALEAALTQWVAMQAAEAPGAREQLFSGRLGLDTSRLHEQQQSSGAARVVWIDTLAPVHMSSNVDSKGDANSSAAAALPPDLAAVKHEKAAPPPHYVRALDELLMQPEAPDDLSGAASSGSSDDTFILAVISGVDPEDVEASSAAAHSPKRRRLNASRCYNCGSYSHTQPQCWRPIDAARAHAAAAEMRSARAAQGAGAGAGQDAGVRYFNMTPSEQMARTYAAARPGAVSSKLATALGMADACAPPPWLSRMVVLGVPPAYSFSSPVSGIDAALYQELRIYDGSEEAAGEAAPPTANGEEAGAAATAAAAASAPPPRSLLPAAGAAAFPGVNAPFPAGADAGKWQEALVDAYLRMSTAEALDHRKQLLAAAEAHEASAQAQQCTPSAQAQQDGEGPADVAGEGAMET